MIIFINKCPDFCISSSTAETNISTNQQENLETIALQPVNQLIMTSAIAKYAPFPRPSTNLQGKQIYISDLYTDHRIFSITPENKFQYQWTLIQ